MSGLPAESAVERRADEMLAAAYRQSPLEVFGETRPSEQEEDAALRTAKEAADLLVNIRFVKYADDGRTQIEITNAGRYWALNGGYLAFLKEDPAAARGGRGRNPEMESLRMEYFKLRLGTFWWSFGFSIASFIFALVSLAVALFYGERLLVR